MKQTRREFLKSSSALAAAPIILPSLSFLRGANDTLNIGIIGCQNRGGWANVQSVRMAVGWPRMRSINAASVAAI